MYSPIRAAEGTDLGEGGSALSLVSHLNGVGGHYISKGIQTCTPVYGSLVSLPWCSGGTGLSSRSLTVLTVPGGDRSSLRGLTKA